MSDIAATTQAKTRIKVWRPQGFTGIEVELFDNLDHLHMPRSFLDGFYEITVARGHQCKLYYMGAEHRFWSKEDRFLVQHPGETLSGSGVGSSAKPLTARTLRLYPKAMAAARAALGLKTEIPYFPSMFADERLNAPLARLAGETISAFDEGASFLECESRLLGLLYAALSHLSDSPPPRLELGQEHQAVSLVKAVLHAHPEVEHRLDDLAQLNKFYLWEVFKRDVGLSPDQYQTGLRVHKAKGLLAQGTSVVQAALEAGFSDQSHLTRVFKKYTQVTPGKFQRHSLAPTFAP